jgi:DnaJ-class molecular chaperone
LHGRPRARAEFSARVAERFASRHGARPEAARGADGPRHAAYRTLGLSASASPREVQRAFRKLAAEQHPDRFPNATASEKAQLLSRFAQLSAAYHVLMG